MLISVSSAMYTLLSVGIVFIASNIDLISV